MENKTSEQDEQDRCRATRWCMREWSCLALGLLVSLAFLCPFNKVSVVDLSTGARVLGNVYERLKAERWHRPKQGRSTLLGTLK